MGKWGTFDAAFCRPVALATIVQKVTSMVPWGFQSSLSIEDSILAYHLSFVSPGRAEEIEKNKNLLHSLNLYHTLCMYKVFSLIDFILSPGISDKEKMARLSSQVEIPSYILYGDVIRVC